VLVFGSFNLPLQAQTPGEIEIRQHMIAAVVAVGAPARTPGRRLV